MILDDNPTLYQSNKLAGYFLNWELSQKYFEGPEYFENLHKINQSFHADPPEVIVDPYNLMPGIIERIPELEKKYKKENGVYLKN